MNAKSQGALAGQRYAVLIVDDHPIVRHGLTQLIAHEPDMEVCGGAETVDEGLRKFHQLQPDLVVVDISLRESNGIDLIEELRSLGPSVKTLVWSMFDETVYAERALRAGALGYVNKQEPVETVVTAIRSVLQGNVYLSPALAAYLVRRVGGGESLERSPVAGLSNRELQVFTLIGQGKTSQEIARRLSVSSKTVETHRERIKMKLNLRNAAELGRRAVLWVLEND